MSSDRESSLVDLDQLERILWWAAGIGYLTLAILITGEFRGWWNDAGEIGSIIVATLTGLVTIIALLINATKDQAKAIREGVTDNGRRLGLIHQGIQGIREDNQGIHQGIQSLREDNQGIHQGIQSLHEDNQRIHQENQRQTAVLVEIRDRL